MKDTHRIYDSVFFGVALLSACAALGIFLALFFEADRPLLTFLIVTEFVCNFFFCVDYFNALFRPKTKKATAFSVLERTLKTLNGPCLFLISIVNVLMAVNVATPEAAATRALPITNFMTNGYAFLLFLYLARAIVTLNASASLLSVDLARIFASRLIISVTAALAALFVALFVALEPVIMERYVMPYSNRAALVAFDLSEQPSDFFEDEAALVEFETKYDVMELYHEGELVYLSSRAGSFRRTHLLFETKIISQEGYRAIVSGKEYLKPLYAFMVCLFALLALVAALIALVIGYGIPRVIAAPMALITKGAQTPSFNRAIDLSAIESEEIARLVTAYNETTLPLKQRDAFMQSLR